MKAAVMQRGPISPCGAQAAPSLQRLPFVWHEGLCLVVKQTPKSTNAHAAQWAEVCVALCQTLASDGAVG